MNTCRQNSLGRQFGTEAIEQRVTEIALLTRKVFPDCLWDNEQAADDMNAPYTHRLIIRIDGREMPVNFSNQEVLTYTRAQRRCMLDHRMHRALNKLFDSSST